MISQENYVQEFDMARDHPQREIGACKHSTLQRDSTLLGDGTLLGVWIDSQTFEQRAEVTLVILPPPG